MEEAVSASQGRLTILVAVGIGVVELWRGLNKFGKVDVQFQQLIENSVHDGRQNKHSSGIFVSFLSLSLYLSFSLSISLSLSLPNSIFVSVGRGRMSEVDHILVVSLAGGMSKELACFCGHFQVLGLHKKDCFFLIYHLINTCDFLEHPVERQ